jgi:salicylate hydroxylase
LQEFGAGLQLTPNATRALRALGALEAVSALATAPRAVRVLRGADGGELAHLPVEDAERRWGAPYLAIHRADLQCALAAAARANGVSLHFDAQVASVEGDETSVSLGVRRAGRDSSERGELLVGADGLRSSVRALAGFGGIAPGGTDAPAFSGKVAFRATVAADRVAPRARANEVTLRIGARAHLVHYPLRDASLVNLAAVIEANWRDPTDEDPWDARADRPALDRAFADWSGDARALIAAPADWRAWPLYVREPLPYFARGLVALIGDAAHPMTPFLAQGAAQAIEDADALGRRLAESAEAAAALAAYSDDRVARATRIQREALAQGRLFHLDGALAVARDLTMLALGPEGVLRRYGWLYAA